MRAIAGGGDTIAALNKADAAKDFTYISTAGGAFLEWLEGKKLPGVEALRLTRGGLSCCLQHRPLSGKVETGFPSEKSL